MTRKLISWVVYACSSFSFLFIFRDAVEGIMSLPAEVFRRDITGYIGLDIMTLVPAGFAALGIRYLPSNLPMAAAGAFVVQWMIHNWQQRDSVSWDMEGWGWLQFEYSVLGVIVTAGCGPFLLVRYMDRKYWENVARESASDLERQS